jgi:hypothetical protein
MKKNCGLPTATTYTYTYILPERGTERQTESKT